LDREKFQVKLWKKKHAFDEKYIFFFENSPVYEIITKHTSELGRP